MSRLIVLISLVVLLITPGIASANLVYNPGFELTGEGGHTDGWTQEWNNNIVGAQDNPRTGAWAARNYNDGGMYQDVSITGGEQYKLTGYAYIPTGVGGSPWGTFIGVKFLRSNGTTALAWEKGNFKDLPRDVYNLGDSGWLSAPADAVTARVRFGTWANDPWIPVSPTDFDDFDLSPIPEPASLVLLGSGLVGLVAFTRKRRI